VAVRGLLAAILVLALAGPVGAHPGRLDADGCHTVRKPGGYTYKSGKIAPQGEYHCHRLLQGRPPKLDGSEVLGERGDHERDEEVGNPRGPEAR